MAEKCWLKGWSTKKSLTSGSPTTFKIHFNHLRWFDFTKRLREIHSASTCALIYSASTLHVVNSWSEQFFISNWHHASQCLISGTSCRDFWKQILTLLRSMKLNIKSVVIHLFYTITESFLIPFEVPYKETDLMF